LGCATPLPGHLLGTPQAFQPLCRWGIGCGLRQLTELRAHDPLLGEPERSCFQSLLVALQVSAYGSIIETAQNPAQPIIPGAGATSPVRLFHVVKSDDTAGNKEIWQQTHRVGAVRSPGALAADHHHEDGLVAANVTVTHAPRYVAMDMQLVYFAAQRAWFP
jgi:hypothetical protein